MSFGLTENNVARLAAMHVDRVLAYAQYVIEVSNGRAVLIKEDHAAPLTVIAVIGLGYFREFLLHRVILAEVGMFRGKPYRNASLGRKGFEGALKIKPRRKFATLTNEQYQLVAPLISSILQGQTDEQISGREFGPHNPRQLTLPGSWWTNRNGNRMISTTVRRIAQTGVRFSVSIHDPLLVQDVYALALRRRELLQQMSSLERLLTDQVFFRRTTADLLRPLRIPFARRQSGRNIQNVIEGSNWMRDGQWWLWVHFVRSLKRNNNSRSIAMFQGELAEMIGWSMSEGLPQELQLADKGLLGATERYGGMQLKVVRQRGDAIVFEVFPDAKSVNERVAKKKAGTADSEVPF